jgi:photosystem II stability/assembly factor-like uncharacterized protein
LTIAAAANAQGRRGRGGGQRAAVNPSDHPIFRDFSFRSIGPAVMGGRVDDIEALDDDPMTQYIGFATSGVWKTENNGTTWRPIFDEYGTGSIGDLAVSQRDPNIVWVGAGEPNNRQSSSFGDGIYKSTDGGGTFAHVGLRDTQTIARIVIDPTDDNVVYAAANGHLFGQNPDRGVFKTTDGGRNWAKVKSVDNDTGFTDIAMDPSDNRTLYAASYQRRRTPWGFNGGGPGSGIWKTTDAGANWMRLEGSGLPTNTMGRIGLSVYRSNPNIVYAQIEVLSAGGRGGRGGRGRGGGGGGEAQAAQPEQITSGVFRSEDKGATWTKMSSNNNRPMYYSQIRVDPNDDNVIYTMGASLYKSTDAGRNFGTLSGMGHGDHHAMWISPRDSRMVLLGTDGGFNVSYDAGATWDFNNTIAAGQFYAVGVDMRRPYYVYGGLQDNGSWGGPSMTRGGPGIINADWFRVGGGDGFYTQVDPTDHNILYTESQNGNMGRLDLSAGTRASIRPSAGGGGRGGRGGGGGNVVSGPDEMEGFRFNWNTPIAISPHNPRTIYTGAQYFFKSVDRGDTWTAGPDLSKNIDRTGLPIMGVAGDAPMVSKNDGVSNYGNITTLAESPAMPGVIWAGTDDGNVQLSRDGSISWANVADNIPTLRTNNHQISRVEPSRFDAATCYVTIDGHRSDDHNPYVFVTRDYGRTWESIASNLPRGNVNVIEEDTKNPNLLFVGTEYGLYATVDGGARWDRFMTGLPVVRVDDIVVHPRDADLVVGTHGRSILIADDITALQQLTPEAMSAPAHLFASRAAIQWKSKTEQSRGLSGTRRFAGENPQAGTAIAYHLSAAAVGPVAIEISNVQGEVIRAFEGESAAGLHRIRWDMRAQPSAPPAEEAVAEGERGGGERGQRGGGGRGGGGGGGQTVSPGTYLVTLKVGGAEYKQTVDVLEDVWMN